MGITGPHIINADRAQKLADACRYVPRGARSFGSGRGAYFGDVESLPDYMTHTNDNVLVIAQLEDAQVLDNIDEILSVDGIDLYASGAQDIAQSRSGCPASRTTRASKSSRRKSATRYTRRASGWRTT